MKNISIIAEGCNLGRGMLVKVEINEMGFFEGTKATIERRFNGSNSGTSRYLAAHYIRDVRKLWREGNLLDTLEGRD